MKRYSTRLISIILSLILVISSLPISAFAFSLGVINETEKSYSVAVGESMSGNNVVFSTLKQRTFGELEYTFTSTSTAEDGTPVGTFSATVNGTTVYLTLDKNNTAGVVNSTSSENFRLISDTTVTDAFVVNQYIATSPDNIRCLYFHDTDSQYRFDRNSALSSTQTAFAFFVKDEGNTTSEIPDYKRVTKTDEIKDGEKYIIAHPSQWNTDGTVPSDATWYFLNPTTELNVYSNVAKMYETSSPDYTTAAYCGRGVGISNNIVTFPEQGFSNMEHAEFTFTGSVSGTTATGTLISKSLGYVTYLNLATAGQPVKTGYEQLSIAKNTVGAENTFYIKGITHSAYLYFHDDAADSQHRFDRHSALSSTQTAFSLFARDPGNKTSGIYGYKRITDVSEIKDGEKYLVAHPSRYNLDGTAKAGSDWFVVFPSKTDTLNYLNVAKVYDYMPYSKAKRIQNGSFEYKADGTKYNGGTISQPKTYEIQAWDTTSIENLSELFTADTNAHMDPSDSTKKYIPDGTYAAELNAEEPGTLYQIVNTIPSSIYLWGLDHRGRTGTDTMALVIGPNQEVKPSKNSGNNTTDDVTTEYKKQYGKDQFMQMVDWAKTQGGIELLSDYTEHKGSNTTDQKLQNITVYSKPFDVNGSFESNDDVSPFSLVPTDEHTEEWHIWIMISGSGDWFSYGSNDKTINAGKNIINDYGNIYSTTLADEKLKEFFYNVPAGQTESMFAFVPIDTADQHTSSTSNGTCGNLVDNINFEVFNPFTASSTDHGSGSVSNTTKGEDFIGDDDVTKVHPISIYTHDNSTQNLIARVSAENAKEDVSFAGIYLTTQDENGDSNTTFLPRKGHEIVENSLKWSEADENKLQTAVFTTESGDEITVSRQLMDDGKYAYDIPDNYWLKREDSSGNLAYIMQLKNVTYATDAHFIFLKSPTVTYDSNSTADYQYKINDTDTSNVYSFKADETGSSVKYIDPVSSHNPVAPNDGWKFTGWKLFDEDGVVKDSDGNDLILSGKNAIACNVKAPANASSTRKFIIVDGKNADEAFNEGKDVTDTDGKSVIGKEWTLKDGVSSVYEKESEALTLVGQWRFKNTFIPEYQDDVTTKDFTQGETGGTVELPDVNTDSDNYSEGENGTKSYFAAAEEQVIATAKAANFYTFIGWYDDKGNVLTTNPELMVNQIKGVTGKYHARFQMTAVTVNFYFLEYNENSKQFEYKVYDSGKYNQYLNKGDVATKPSGDSKNVKTWFTSRSELGTDTAYNFSNKVYKSIDLYAAPAFTFNYYNEFQFQEPWKMITSATLKFDGNYIDMKTNADITDYKVYILKASSKDETMPTASEIKSNSNTLVVGKDDDGILFNNITNINPKFNRIGALYNNLYIYNMNTPVWVTFEFKYRGVTFTANVKNRSLYNNIDTFRQTAENYPHYTSYKTEQDEVLQAIQDMYKATEGFNINEASTYKASASVSDEMKSNVSTSSEYTFTSSTAIRNIEPWGFKYTFGVNDHSISDFSDYGAVVLSNPDEAPADAKALVNNEKAVMYSKSTDNIYASADDATKAAAYHVEGIKMADYQKSTYVVFFVKDSSGKYYYSDIVSNSYESVANADESDYKTISQAILTYAEKYAAYQKKLEELN